MSRNIRGIGRIILVVVIVVMIVIAGVGAFYYSTLGKSISSSTTTPTTSSLASSISTALSSSSSLQLSSSTQTTSTAAVSSTTSSSSPSPSSLVVEEGAQPDSMDPAVEFTTPGNEITFNVYQGLVTPNGKSSTSYIGELATNWTVSANQMTWDFNLRQGVHFSNGDPFNAYVMWYSLYRTIVMNQLPAFILSQNFGVSNGANINITDSILNSINYTSPSQQNISLMETPNQSFQVLNESAIRLQLGYGYNGNSSYSAFLATITSPCAFAVDPNYVTAHGGVTAGQPNPWMQTHALGTGFYLLDSWVQGQSVKLVINPNYWGNTYTQSQLNYAIQPATLSSVIIYYKPTSSRIADLQSGFAQIIGAPDVTEAADLNTVKGIPNVNVTVYPIQFGSAEAAYFVYMNPFIDSQFQNILVREAVVKAIDYSGIISNVFKGLAQQWIGPVPPGFPYYANATQGLAPYTNNSIQAAELLAQAGYIATLPNGTKLDPNGQTFPTLNFVYTSDSVSESQVASIISSELGSIGINVQLSPMPFPQYSNLLFSPIAANSSAGFGIGFWSEDYVASQDYATGIAGGNTTGNPTYFSNVSSWVTEASSALDNVTLVHAFQNISSTLQNNYVAAWLYVPDFIAINENNVVGMVPNPAGSCAGYFMYYNTVHYAS